LPVKNSFIWVMLLAAGSACAQWPMASYDSMRADAVDYALHHGGDIADAWAALERQGTELNERANEEFRREHAYRPPAPAKLSAGERKRIEKAVAEYEAIQAACAAAKQGNYDAALEEIAKVPGGDRDINVVKFRARVHTSARRYDLALLDYDTLLGLARDMPNLEKHSAALARVYIQRSRVLELARQFDAAQAELDQAVKVGGPYLDPYLVQVEQAELHLNAGKLAQAVDDFTDLLQRFASADRYGKRGYAYFWLGEREKAKADLNRAIAGKTSYAPAWLSHAYLAALDGDSKAAIEECDFAIQRVPKDAYAHAVKGEIYRSLLNEPGKAVEEFDTALRLDPDLKQAAEWRAKAKGRQ
jgi:tetratricopeptide (TPR) repeat protein